MSKTRMPPKTVPPSSNGKPRGRPFQVGNTSGRGRPRGSPNKSTLLARAVLTEHAEEVTETLVALAKQGVPFALRLVVERIHPLRHGAPVPWDMPPMRSADDVILATRTLLESVAKGDVTPTEANEILPLLKEMERSFNFGGDTESRLRQLNGMHDQLTDEQIMGMQVARCLNPLRQALVAKMVRGTQAANIKEDAA